MKKCLKAAQIFSDNMVLQRNQNVFVWGEGRKNSIITVTINGHMVKTKTIEYNWSVEIPRMEAGGPYILTISDGVDEIAFHDVMIGEVWLAGGQSNMEMELQNSLNGMEEAHKADNKLIRFYNTAHIATLEEKDLEGDTLQRMVEKILNDKLFTNKMKNNLKKFEVNNSATIIYDEIVKLVGNKDERNN